MFDKDALLGKLAGVSNITLREIAPGFPVLDAEAGGDAISVSLYGGQLLSCRIAGRERLWQNRAAHYLPGKAIRAGVPICWPWFGNAAHASLPAHGFVRTRYWQLDRVLADADEMTLVLQLQDDAATRAIWPHQFALELRIHFGKLAIGHALSLNLNIRNTGTTPWQFSGALHSYFAISDIAAVGIERLQPIGYFDQLSQQHCPPTDWQTLTQEADRIYRYPDAPLYLFDDGDRQALQLTQRGSTDTVLWSPWTEKAARLPDIAAEDWRQFVCLETAIAGGNAITLAAQARYRLGFTLRPAVYGEKLSTPSHASS